MHIVCVAHSYPRFEGDVAGAFIERLNLGLRAREHSVKVIAPSDHGAGGRERLSGISVSRVRYAPAALENLAYTGEMRERSRSPLGALAAASLITAQAVEIGHLHGVSPIDVVHAHWWVPGGASAWLAHLVGKPPYVVTLHGSDVRILEKSWAGRWIARRVLRGAAAVTAVSSFLAEEIARFAGLSVDSIHVQPMPIDVERFTGVSRGGAGVVTIGRLTEQKNVDMVLEAIAKLRRDGRKARLKVIGDGPQRQRLEYRAKGLQIDDVTTFVGSVAPADIPAAIGDADVMVFPAHREGLGLVTAEALLLGVPVVASQEGGGVRDIVPPTGAGKLVPAHDANVLANAIDEFLDNPAALYLAQQTGESLRKRLEPGAVAQTFEEIYASVTRPRSPDA